MGAMAGSDDFFGTLVDMQEDISTRRNVGEMMLAGQAEGTVSSLIEHFYVPEASQMGFWVSGSLDVVLDLDLNSSGLLLDVSDVSDASDSISRVVIHKFQVLLRAETHRVLTTKKKKHEYKDGMIAHLKQIALEDSKATMLNFFENTITTCYADCQPELLVALQDQLKLEWPAEQTSPHTSHLGRLSEPGQEMGSCAPGSVEGEVDMKELAGARSKVTVALKEAKHRGPTVVVPSKKTKLNQKKKMDNVEGRGEEIVQREDVDTERCQPTVKEESPIMDEKGALDHSSYPNENEANPLDAELKDKEAKLHELLTSEAFLIESKGKEMSVLISAVDDIEDEKNSKKKKVAEIDANIRELQISKGQLVKDIEDEDQKLEKLLIKKNKLENFIAERMSDNKQAKRQLEKEIEDIKAKRESQRSQETERNKIEELQPENLRLLEYIDSKIEAKEKELECPVCFEVASVPIFCCDDQHIICSDCRPKVSS